MIRQIWFVKNERKLINNLCIAINIVILLYCILSVWGLENGVVKEIFGHIDLLIIPLFSLILSVIMYRISNSTKTSKSVLAKCNQLRRDIIIGSNLWISLALTFIGLDKISKAKSIDGFGLLPVCLCAAGGILFYIIRYSKYKKSIQNEG